MEGVQRRDVPRRHRDSVTHDQLTLHLTNRLTEIPRGAALIRAFCARLGVADTVANAVNLAVEELLANTIAYGYGDTADHEIVVRLWREETELVIDLTDDGGPFDPTTVPTPDLSAPLEARRVGGLGIHLVRSLMDRIAYRRDGALNCITLRKTIVPAPL